MTVQDYLRVFRERWLVIVIAVLLGLGVGLGAFLLRPATYTAQISLYVSAQVGADPQQAYLGAQLSEQRVKSYTGLVTSPRVMKGTVRRLGLSESPETLAGDVEASSTADSIVIDVSATQRTPQQAAAVADTVGDVFTGLVDELERPSSPDNVAPVAIRVVQPADVPQSPSSVGLPLTLAIGLFAGLVIGAAIALARNAFDTRLRCPDELASVTGAPTLGVIAFDPGVPRTPLLVREDPQNPRSEAFRQLRTNLQFVDVDSPRTVLMVTSSMPAEGKSTTVANLAVALAAAGSSVLVIEADLRRPKLAALLGVEQTVGLTRVLSGRLRFAQAVQPWGGGMFDVLASGPLPPNPSELLGSLQMRALIDEARAGYDVVLIDSPPLLPVTDAAALAPATDGAVVVCRYRSTSRSQLSSAVAALRAVSVDPLGTVFTMVPSRGPRAYAQYNAFYRSEAPAVAPAGPAGEVPGRPYEPGATGGPPPGQAPPPWQPPGRVTAGRAPLAGSGSSVPQGPPAEPGPQRHAVRLPVAGEPGVGPGQPGAGPAGSERPGGAPGAGGCPGAPGGPGVPVANGAYPAAVSRPQAGARNGTGEPPADTPPS